MTQPRTPSLRGRLLAIVLSATLLIWLAAGLISYRTALGEVDRLLDGQMMQAAKLLMAQIRHEEQELSHGEMVTQVLEAITLSPYEQPLRFQVWDLRGHLVMRTATAPNLTRSSQAGFATLEHTGEGWRIFTANDRDSAYQVQVIQALADRHRTALAVASRAVIPMLIAIPILAFLVYWGVRGGLAPLHRLANDVGARDPEHLDALANSTTPIEVRPLIRAINALMARLDKALDNERRFTADAAHELRTPLAAIKVHAQVAEASLDEAGCKQALGQVLAGTDRAGRLVEQLLRLARLDPLRGLDAPQPVDLATLARQECDALFAKAEAHGLVLQTQGSLDAVVSGDPDMLAVALRNLIENALRHTPPGGRVTVSTEIDGAIRRLRVHDSGTGVANADLPHLGERFFRGDSSIGEGSGLGLAIVRRIAELHGAQLRLANHPEGGFEATLEFPQARPAG